MKSKLFFYLWVSLFFASSCDTESASPGLITDGGDSDTNSDQDTGLPEVTSEQEDEMCGDLDSSTGKFINAGGEIGDGQVITPGSGGFLVQLADLGGNFGGFVELAGEEGDILFMLFKEDVPVSVLESGGDELPDVDTNAGPGSCADAWGAYLWVLDGAPNYLEFGPTSAKEVHIALEKVE